MTDRNDPGTLVKRQFCIILIIMGVRCKQKCSHIFGSEEPNLIAIRTKSYCPKNQILLPEDMAAFFAGARCVAGN